MKVLLVVFATAATTYSYIYNGDVDVQVGDWAVANNALVTVKGVTEEKDYKATLPVNELSVLKEIKYVISRQAERDEATRVARIAEIKTTLCELQKKAELRKTLEGMANDAGAEGKKLLAELEELEGDL